MSFLLPMASAAVVGAVPLPLIVPFVLLLLLIAVMPLAGKRVHHWWEANYPFVAAGLGLAVATYYLARMEGGGAMLQHTLHEYVSFIALIGALFVVAGGIHLKVSGEATPLENVVFLAVGAVLANFIGTTGASMVLIRPWIRMNKIRVSGYHVVFFIFVVSNIGGALTPIGDPPLFLGFLRGVPFFWLVEHVLVQWLATLAAILAIFYWLDRRSFVRMPGKLRHHAEQPEAWRFDGGINVFFLLAIVGAVFFPAKFFLREIVMLGAAVASWFLTPKPVHAENHFTFAPIKEVAWLFLGIFVTMMPALDYLARHGRDFGFAHPLGYYFASGGLSAVLDNAPTYVNFLQLAQAAAAPTSSGFPLSVAGLLAAQPQLVVAISLGSVFFGAMTYIGNGPNFMVKSIAHNAHVHCPSFFGYLFKYALPILLPILALSGWMFL